MAIINFHEKGAFCKHDPPPLFKDIAFFSS